MGYPLNPEQKTNKQTLAVCNKNKTKTLKEVGQYQFG